MIGAYFAPHPGTGPDRLERHPIHTRILGRFPGTALVSDEGRGLFGARHEDCCRRTGGLPPSTG
jgi:hypothetical protein